MLVVISSFKKEVLFSVFSRHYLTGVFNATQRYDNSPSKIYLANQPEEFNIWDIHQTAVFKKLQAKQQ